VAQAALPAAGKYEYREEKASALIHPGGPLAGSRRPRPSTLRRAARLVAVTYQHMKKELRSFRLSAALAALGPTASRTRRMAR
jgi:hypothetical protein